MTDFELYEYSENKLKEAKKRIVELEAIVKNTKAVDESFALQSVQLTKATEIIKNLIAIYYDPVVLENDIELHKKIITEAKQFISEVEK